MKFLSLGDSHTIMFRNRCAAMCIVPGATAYGLKNGSSITNGRNIFSSILQVTDYVPIICLGEVDCNSLLWRLEANIQDFIDQSTSSLVEFLSSHNKPFIVSSVILPPVDNYQETQVRTFVHANKVERTAVVKQFNNLLKQKSTSKGHLFLDLTPDIEGEDGLLNPYFAKSPRETHLDNKKIIPVIKRKLNEAKSFYNNL